MKSLKINVCVTAALVLFVGPAANAEPSVVKYETTIVNSIFHCPRAIIAQVPENVFVQPENAYWTLADATVHVLFSRDVKSTDLGGVVVTESEDVADLQIKEHSVFDGSGLKSTYECKLVKLEPKPK